jgi:hypothetical protein
MAVSAAMAALEVRGLLLGGWWGPRVFGDHQPLRSLFGFGLLQGLNTRALKLT